MVATETEAHTGMQSGYRPQVAKVIFLHLFVILFTGGGWSRGGVSPQIFFLIFKKKNFFFDFF